MNFSLWNSPKQNQHENNENCKNNFNLSLLLRKDFKANISGQWVNCEPKSECSVHSDLTFKKLGFPPTNSFQKVFGEIKQQQKTPKGQQS